VSGCIGGLRLELTVPVAASAGMCIDPASSSQLPDRLRKLRRVFALSRSIAAVGRVSGKVCARDSRLAPCAAQCQNALSYQGFRVGQSDGPSSSNDPKDAAPSEPSTGKIERENPTHPMRVKGKLRPSMMNTLRTGVTTQNSWRLRPSQPPPPSAAPAASEGSGVHALKLKAAEVIGASDDQVTRTPPRAAGTVPMFAEAQRDLNNPAEPPRHHVSAPRNSKLARTLRMELGIGRDPSASAELPPARPPILESRTGTSIGVGHEPEPEREPGIDAPPQVTNPSQRPPNMLRGKVSPGKTQRIQRVGTNPDLSGPANPNKRSTRRGADPMATMQTGRATWDRLINAIGGPPSADSRWTRAESQSRTPQSPGSDGQQPTAKRHRPNARTMVLKHGAPPRDWLFVGLLVCALVVTASLLFSYRSQQASEDESEREAATSENAITAQDQDQAAHASTRVVATELLSNPSGAEVVVAGAVVGNTPVRVARGDQDTDYLVRMSGYEPQLVRVNAVSPPSILVTLKAQHAASEPTQ
jgi:hypothetical protein